jgi:hypothetical protein
MRRVEAVWFPGFFVSLFFGFAGAAKEAWFKELP